jgi:hypothetical protein
MGYLTNKEKVLFFEPIFPIQIHRLKVLLRGRPMHPVACNRELKGKGNVYSTTDHECPEGE